MRSMSGPGAVAAHRPTPLPDGARRRHVERAGRCESGASRIASAWRKSRCGVPVAGVGRVADDGVARVRAVHAQLVAARDGLEREDSRPRAVRPVERERAAREHGRAAGLPRAWSTRCAKRGAGRARAARSRRTRRRRRAEDERAVP